MATKLGFRLRRFREGLHLTQDELARAVGLSSKFISQIEIGNRTPSLQSLKKIADYVRKDIAAFLSEEQDPFQRLLSDRNIAGARVLVRRFRDHCLDYLRLEEMTGRRLPPAPLYEGESPRGLAEAERKRMGAGEEPIRNIFDLLENHGLRLLREPFPRKSRLSGLFVYFPAEQAAFGLLDENLSDGRMAIAAAHLYGHYLRDRHDGPIADNTDIFVNDYLPLYHPRERFAQEFALAFLVPRDQVRRLIRREIASDRIRYEDLIRLKRYFGVPVETMMNLLADTGILSAQRAGEFASTDHAAFELSLFTNQIGDRPPVSPGKTVTSNRYRTLGVIAMGSRPSENS